MRRSTLFIVFLVTTGVFGFAQQAEQTELTRAQDELTKLRGLVEAGAAPRARLEEAERAIADAQDEAILHETLFGIITVENVANQDPTEMLQAAQRRVDRQQDLVQHQKKLVQDGLLAASSLQPLVDELEVRRQAMRLAQSRGRLIEEFTTILQRQHAMQEAAIEAGQGRNKLIERNMGKGSLSERDFVTVAAAYRQRFLRPLPISASGETATHRAMGFDHRGRYDIALNPDQQEGVWLRRFLLSAKIPYFAFRSAIAGKATAPHIHIGPPSLRYRMQIAD